MVAISNAKDVLIRCGAIQILAQSRRFTPFVLPFLPMMRKIVSFRDGVLPFATMAVGSLAAVLLLAAGSPPPQAQGEPLAPDDQAAFDDLVVGQRMALDDNLFSSFYYVDFVAAGRFRETDSPGIFTGSYTYENTGSDTGTLTFNYDDGDHFTERLNLVFTSTTSGTATATVNGEESPQFNWRLSPIPESEPLRTLHFPDYADGGGWSVQLAASHISTATEDAAVLVTAYDREGQPIPEFFDFDNPFEIPPLGTRVLTSAATYPEREFRRGWIEVKTDTASVSGLLTYRNAVTGVEVSVEPVELGSHFALFVEESTDVGTGLAIFKPELDSTIEFRIYGEDGVNPLGEGFARAGGFNQDALTIPGWFAVDGIDTEFLEDFRGLLFLRAEDGSLFAPLALRFKRGRLSAVPVIRVTDEGGSNDGGEPDTDDQTCAAGSVIRPGAKCNLKDADGNTIGTFDVANNGTGCLRIGGVTSCSSRGSHNLDNVTINQYRITFVASRGADGNWSISKISIS